MAEPTVLATQIPARLRQDLATLADQALTVLLMVDELVDGGERLREVLEYLADDESKAPLEAYLHASGYQTFSDVVHVIYDILHESMVISGFLTFDGRKLANESVEKIAARRRGTPR